MVYGMPINPSAANPKNCITMLFSITAAVMGGDKTAILLPIPYLLLLHFYSNTIEEYYETSKIFFYERLIYTILNKKKYKL